MEVIICVTQVAANWLFWHEDQQVSNYVTIKTLFSPSLCLVLLPHKEGMVCIQLDNYRHGVSVCVWGGRKIQ